jgi:hypothetical protein
MYPQAILIFVFAVRTLIAMNFLESGDSGDMVVFPRDSSPRYIYHSAYPHMKDIFPSIREGKFHAKQHPMMRKKTRLYSVYVSIPDISFLLRSYITVFFESYQKVIESNG